MKKRNNNKMEYPDGMVLRKIKFGRYVPKRRFCIVCGEYVDVEFTDAAGRVICPKHKGLM